MEKRCLIYLFRAGEYVKVGVTTDDLGKRLKAVQSCCPLIVSIAATLECQEWHLRGVEKAAHDWLKKQGKHVVCEWFLVAVEEEQALLSLIQSAIDVSRRIEYSTRLTNQRERRHRNRLFYVLREFGPSHEEIIGVMAQPELYE